MKILPFSVALAGACTIPPPTMMAPLDDAMPMDGGTVSITGHVGGAVVPAEDSAPTMTAGGDLELALAPQVSIAVSGGAQNQSLVGQLSARIRTGGTLDEGWIGQIQFGVGYAVLTDTEWFDATPAIGIHAGLGGSAAFSDTGRGFIGAMVNLSMGLDQDQVTTPFTYVGGGATWNLPSGPNAALVIGIQAYGLGIVVPVSPGIAGQLGARFGKGAGG